MPRDKQDLLPEEDIWLVDHALTLDSTTELCLEQEPGLVTRLASMLELGPPSLGDPHVAPAPLGGRSIDCSMMMMLVCSLSNKAGWDGGG